MASTVNAFDPHHVADTFCDLVLNIYRRGGNIHVTLAVERLSSETMHGPSDTSHFDGCGRLVMTEATAGMLSQMITASLGKTAQPKTPARAVRSSLKN